MKFLRSMSTSELRSTFDITDDIDLKHFALGSLHHYSEVHLFCSEINFSNDLHSLSIQGKKNNVFLALRFLIFASNRFAMLHIFISN